MKPGHPKYESKVLATNPSIRYCKQSYYLPKYLSFMQDSASNAEYSFALLHGNVENVTRKDDVTQMVTIMEIHCRDCGKSRNSVTTVCVRAEIPTRHLTKTLQKNYSLSQLSRWHKRQPVIIPGTTGSDQTTSGIYVRACYFPPLIFKNSKLRACFILT
jgi:hypothetical protein